MTTTRRRDGKLAEKVARKIEREIIKRGWPVGESLGSEPELVERYSVSRAAFREAVRIVEHHAVARMRSGPHGGLIVTAPDPQAVQRAATLYLDYADVSPHDLLQVRTSLELGCVRQVTEEGDETRLQQLREVLSDEEEREIVPIDEEAARNFHVVLAGLTGNVAMRLFVETITWMTYERAGGVTYGRWAMDDTHQAHTRITDAIAAGDVATAQDEMRRHLVAIGAFYESREGR